METIGLFRTRVMKDGGVEIWAKGWRLGSQAPALVPVVLSGAFLLAPFGVAVRGAGCVVLLVCGWLTLRLSRLGFRVDAIGITVHGVMRSRTVAWPLVEGFVGSRNEHEGRCVLLTTDGERLRSPGTLEPDEMDPFWSEGAGDEASAVDQLNRTVTQLRRAFTAPGRSASAIDLGRTAKEEEPDRDEVSSPGARRLRSL